MSRVRRERVVANGLEFDCLRQGEGDRLGLCTGSPDDAGTTRPLLDRLAAAGFTAVAPCMRGYGPTDPAPDGDYTTVAMAKDAAALADELADGCIGHELFDNADEAFAGRCRCGRIRGAGHFLHRERPDVVADEILLFVG
jgi:pimeloyl-ACP methyl ester carboxylesterase